jgi:hypothetical protein
MENIKTQMQTFSLIPLPKPRMPLRPGHRFSKFWNGKSSTVQRALVRKKMILLLPSLDT